jgi:hypothetical protein
MDYNYEYYTYVEKSFTIIQITMDKMQEVGGLTQSK